MFNENATVLWRKYELQTTRLSQQLAEQLRLVMEPTLASKLQGDYKTGKRINMKKVILYIARHYREDKIWLRWTRPNKHNYQVVIAVDDSRSIAESQCGDVASEALVTVCWAMSQLEVGNLAIASFGQKGNVKENLKCCVRDVLSRKRMVTFLLLDSPQESMMDRMEVSFLGGNMKFANYLDSFPFLYYIVLKNSKNPGRFIEKIHTLANDSWLEFKTSYLGGYTAEVTTLFPRATEKDVKEFFAYCGEIEHVEIIRLQVPKTRKKGYNHIHWTLQFTAVLSSCFG